jgi:hypothetical protein
MKIHFSSSEVNGLAEDLRKIRRKNRCLLSRKDLECLKRASQALGYFEGLRRRKPRFFKKAFSNIIKFFLKFFA